MDVDVEKEHEQNCFLKCLYYFNEIIKTSFNDTKHFLVNTFNNHELLAIYYIEEEQQTEMLEYSQPPLSPILPTPPPSLPIEEEHNVIDIKESIQEKKLNQDRIDKIIQILLESDEKKEKHFNDWVDVNDEANIIFSYPKGEERPNTIDLP